MADGTEAEAVGMTRAAIFAYLRERLHVSTDNADAFAERLADMPDRVAHALMLRAEGYTQKEIGKRVGCSERHAGRLISDYCTE